MSTWRPKWEAGKTFVKLTEKERKLSKTLIAVLSVLGIFVLIGIIAFFMVVGAYNSGNDSEARIPAIYENNENILAQFGQTVQEIAQVPGMQRDDIVAIFTGTLDARYGEDGSQAGWQWIQEQNPNLDQSTYTAITQAIESGRADFRRAQTLLVDAKRNYCRDLGSFPGGMLMQAFGYPNIEFGCARVGQSDEDDQYPAITTARAQNAFESGVEDGPIQLRQ